MNYERLTDEDVEILELESPTIAGHIVKVGVLDSGSGAGRPTLDELRRHVVAGLGSVPRLRQRLAETPLSLANPVWIDDESFSIGNHVRQIADTEEVDDARLRVLVAEAIATRLDRAHPLWAIDYIANMTGNRAAFIWRVHHCMADGTTALRIAEDILWDQPGEATVNAGEAAWRARPTPSQLDLLASGIRDQVGGAIGSVEGLAAAVSSPTALLGGLRTAASLPLTLVRELSPIGDRTPLDRHPSTRRSVSFVSTALADLKHIEKAFGEQITVNDVLLATVAGGVRKWLQNEGQLVANLRVKVPTSLHSHDAQRDALGNRDSALFVDLPLREPDPVERLRAINRETVERKRQHDPEKLDSFMHDLRFASKSLEHLAGQWESDPRVFALNISNVPGPREPVGVMGMNLTHFYSLPEIGDRHALRVSAISVAGTLFYGLNADAEAIGDLETIATGIEAEIAALLDAAV